MSWLELRINTQPKQAEQLEELLLALEASAVTYTDAGDQPILEPGIGEMPLWPEIVLVALFEGGIDTETKIAELNALFPEEIPPFRWNILENRIWEREWLKHHKPVKFSDSFWVFHEAIEDSALPTLLLDPGLAFGTGSHPTTAMCLEWIAKQDWRHMTLIDYGCGSGILAIAALLLKCPYVQCTDIDPQALSSTRSNANRNKIATDKLSIHLAGQEPNTLSDALVANILAGPLASLAETFAGKVKANGKICLSGILAEQEQSIQEAYSHWFEQIQIKNKEDWLCITARRKCD